MKTMNPIIQTECLVLRPIALSDFKTACAYACDKENTRFMIYLSAATKFSVFRFLCRMSREWKKKNQHTYEFAVIEKSSGQHIGGVGLESTGDGAFEIGWIFAKDFHGKGCCTEAALSLVAWGKETLGAKKIFAHADEGNTPSISVMKKLGMKQCGFGFRLYKDGRQANEVMYEMDL